jgi:hypothetical protein
MELLANARTQGSGVPHSGTSIPKIAGLAIAIGAESQRGATYGASQYGEDSSSMEKTNVS